MPFDGTDYQPEQRLEERALRHALAFFTDESKWASGVSGSFKKGNVCVGVAMLKGGGYGIPYSFAVTQTARDEVYQFISRALGKPDVISWNDTTNFATMMAHLRTRIAYYEDQRMKVAA